MIPLLIILGVVGAVAAKSAIVNVPPRHVFVVTRLGKFHTVLHPGTNLITPFMDAVAQKYSLDEQQLKFTEDVRTRDEEKLHVEAKVRYRVLDAKTAFANVSSVEDFVRAGFATALRQEAEARTGNAIRDDRRAFREAAIRTADNIVKAFGAKIVDAAVETPRGF